MGTFDKTFAAEILRYELTASNVLTDHESIVHSCVSFLLGSSNL